MTDSNSVAILALSDGKTTLICDSHDSLHDEILSDGYDPSKLGVDHVIESNEMFPKCRNK